MQLLTAPSSVVVIRQPMISDGRGSWGSRNTNERAMQYVVHAPPIGTLTTVQCAQTAQGNPSMGYRVQATQWEIRRPDE